MQASQNRRGINIDYPESASIVITKTCGCTLNKRKVTYAFLNDTHALCIDKKDLISAQIEACERLMRYVIDGDDINTVKKETAELRMALDLLT